MQDTVNSIVTDMLQWPHRIVVPLGVNVDTRLVCNAKVLFGNGILGSKSLGFISRNVN
jgi:hypothetical protein